MNIRSTIKEEMKIEQMTVYRLSQLSGVNRSTLSRFLVSRKSISIDNLEKICKALQLELSTVHL